MAWTNSTSSTAVIAWAPARNATTTGCCWCFTHSRKNHNRQKYYYIHTDGPYIVPLIHPCALARSAHAHQHARLLTRSASEPKKKQKQTKNPTSICAKCVSLFSDIVQSIIYVFDTRRARLIQHHYIILARLGPASQKTFGHTDMARQSTHSNEYTTFRQCMGGASSHPHCQLLHAISFAVARLSLLFFAQVRISMFGGDWLTGWSERLHCLCDRLAGKRDSIRREKQTETRLHRWSRLHVCFLYVCSVHCMSTCRSIARAYVCMGSNRTLSESDMCLCVCACPNDGKESELKWQFVTQRPKSLCKLESEYWIQTDRRGNCEVMSIIHWYIVYLPNLYRLDHLTALEISRQFYLESSDTCECCLFPHFGPVTSHTVGAIPLHLYTNVHLLWISPKTKSMRSFRIEEL